jgi:hypothetical protein
LGKGEVVSGLGSGDEFSFFQRGQSHGHNWSFRHSCGFLPAFGAGIWFRRMLRERKMGHALP